MAPAVNAYLPTMGTAYSRFSEMTCIVSVGALNSTHSLRRSAKKHWEPNPFSSGGIRVNNSGQNNSIVLITIFKIDMSARTALYHVSDTSVNNIGAHKFYFCINRVLNIISGV